VIDDCIRRSAGRTVHSKLIPAVMDLRLRHFEKANDASGCRTSAEIWEGLNRTDPDSLLRAARFRAVTAKVERRSAVSKDATERADAEAVLAVEWLRKAIVAGAPKSQVADDREFDELRDRPDFRMAVDGPIPKK
jgi:hypothetical protein